MSAKRRIFLPVFAAVACGSAMAKPMAIFSRAQMKYGAERSDFIHRWYERPLHQDTSYQEAADGHFLNPAAWRKTAETVRLSKLNGFAACLTQAQRNDIIGRSAMPGGEMEVLVELPYSFGDEKAVSDAYKTVEMAAKMPNAYKIGGRIVLTRYPACRDSQLWFYSKLRDDLKAKYGDKFAVVPYFSAWEKDTYDPKTADAAARATVKERLRRLLRGTDGMVLAIAPSYVNRRFDAEFFHQHEGRVVKEVFDEPEFKGRKILGVLTRCGHENSYRWQYTHDSQGTRTMCETLSAAVWLGADFAFCPEWDEENENTHFRPTVCNAFSSARITRYFADTVAGRQPEPFPGDDKSIPNLILSYRKSVTAGEPLEVEVRNVPDGTFDGSYEVAFGWCDEKGDVIRKFPSRQLKAAELTNVWFIAKATEFAASHRLLSPMLAVRWTNGRTLVRRGLWPVDVNVLRNVDHKWVKQPLRDVMKGVSASLEIGEPDDNGMRMVRGKVKAGAPMRSVEVLDDVDAVYVHSSDAIGPDGFEQFRIQYKGQSANGGLTLNGTVRLEGCTAVSVGGINSRDRGARKAVPFKDGAWTFKDIPFDNWGGTLLFTVSSSDVATGKVVFDLGPTVQSEVLLKDLIEKDEIGFTASDCRGIVISRSPVTEYLPKPFGGTEAEFSFKWKPMEKASVLRLQVIGDDYRLWRGEAKTVAGMSGRKSKIHVFERDDRTVTELDVDDGLFERIDMDFSRRRGSVAFCGTGRALAAMEGASACLAHGFGQGESHYGNPIIRYLKPGMAAARGWWLMPMQAVPGFAGFSMEMEVKPNSFGRRQGLYGAGNCGFTLQLEADGSLLALLAQGNAYLLNKGSTQARLVGPKLKAGEWNRVVFATDRRTMWFEVNGVRGESRPYCDYFWNQRYGVLCGIHPTMDFLDGEMRKFAVNPL